MTFYMYRVLNNVHKLCIIIYLCNVQSTDFNLIENRKLFYYFA